MLWKKDRKFWVEYSGTVTVGIDVSLMNVEVEGNCVTITMPPAKVLGCKVDEETLSEASFIVAKDSAKVKAEHQTQVFREAQEKMEEAASNDTALLANAQQRVKDLLENYVTNVGDCTGKSYTIRWKSIENPENLNINAVSTTAQEATE